MSDPFVRLSRSDLQSVQEAALNLAEASSRLAAELTDILCGGYWINEAENDKLRIFLQFRALEDGPPPTLSSCLGLAGRVSGCPQRHRPARLGSGFGPVFGLLLH